MRIIKQLKQIEIVQHLSVLVSGTVLAQLLTILFQVVLRRVFTPEDFGAFAVYMSIVGIAITIMSLRFEQTILLPKEHDEGLKLTKLSIYIAICFSFLFAIALYFLAEHFMKVIGLEETYKHWLVYLPITILLFGVYQSLNYLLIRLKLYPISGSNKVARRATEGVTQSLFGYFSNNVGLVVGDILGQFVIIIRTIFKLRKESHLFNTPDRGKTTKELIIRYKAYPIKNTIPALLNTLSRLLPVIIISRFYNAEITGFYDLARVVLILPMSLITVSLNQVFVQQFAQKRNHKHSIRKESLLMFFGLFVFAVCFVVIIKAFGVDLFQIIFGDQWESAGRYAQILVWAFALKFVIAPFNATFIAFEKISIGSIWQVFYFTLIGTLFFIQFQNFEAFLRYFVFIEIIAFLTVGVINFVILYSYEKGLKENVTL